MNRADAARERTDIRVPRIRGDEPEVDLGEGEWTGVFPAYAGMNRAVGCERGMILGVPRIRGDEPNLRANSI